METRSLAATMLWVALSASAAAQDGAELRPAPKPVTTVGAEYSYATFQGDIDSWHMGAIFIGQRRQAGSVIARLNLARRFATNGAQLEVGGYPQLGKDMYAYLNAGHSGSTNFPEWRLGAELFRQLPHAFEASGGFRQLRFNVTDPVTLFTGSVGQHSGSYWYSLRPYLRDKTSGLSASASLTVRRYYEDADNYIGARAEYGSSPTEDVQLSQLNRTRSTSAALTASRSGSSRAVTTWSFSFEREELAPSRFRNRWELGGGMKIRVGPQ